jgi:hypothetical protein
MSTSTPGPLHRIAPAAGLFLLAPLVAEFLLGNLPITMLAALLALAPLYGGGALLIRELTRRAGRGVPTMLVLGIAYGLAEEGITTQSLFNPDYAGAHLLADGFIPALGIAGPWTLFVLSLHAIWSTTASIVVAEALVRGRRTTPWLRTPGLVVTAVLFVLGIVATTYVNLAVYPFSPRPAQMAAVVAIVALLVALAFRLPRAGDGAPGTAPHPAVVAVIGLVAGAVFFLAGNAVSGWAYVVIVLVMDAGLALAVRRWAARAAWTPLHTLALAGAALLTYAWHSFPESPLTAVAPAVDTFGNAVFTVGAVVVLVLAFARTRHDRWAHESAHSHSIRTTAG